jgi:hypothetical protein
MVAMFLDFIVVISPLVSFEIGVCTLMKVIIALVSSWEITPMDNPSKSSRERLGQPWLSHIYIKMVFFPQIVN